VASLRQQGYLCSIIQNIYSFAVRTIRNKDVQVISSSCALKRDQCVENIYETQVDRQFSSWLSVSRGG